MLPERERSTVAITVADLQRRLDTRTKPQGSLGRLETLAIRIGLALQSQRPRFTQPRIMVFAADHGIASAGVSAYPAAVTAQMVANYLSGGAAINVLARQLGLALAVIDAGVASPLAAAPGLVDCKMGLGTRNYLHEPAMTVQQRDEAIEKGRRLAAAAIADGSNALLLGEMGIGNTASAALLLHRMTQWPLADCVGRGTGLDDAGLERKVALLQSACSRCPGVLQPLDALAEFGGFELVMLVGAIIEAAHHRCVIVIDGFAVTVAAYLASFVDESVLAHCIFSHCSAEKAHRALLARLDATPILDLDLRLGEASGAALAWPLIDASARLLSDMASFESAGVSDRA